jgi:hypothetical protein
VEGWFLRMVSLLALAKWGHIETGPLSLLSKSLAHPFSEKGLLTLSYQRCLIRPLNEWALPRL